MEREKLLFRKTTRKTQVCIDSNETNDKVNIALPRESGGGETETGVRGSVHTDQRLKGNTGKKERKCLCL